MPFSVLVQMTLTAILTVWSPGPNNILLLSTASRFGLKKNLPFMAGIWTGSMTLMTLSGLLCRALARVIPGIQPFMSIAGGIYLIYLAWGTFRRCPPGQGKEEALPTYFQGILLQLINVKIILYGLTMFSTYILPWTTALPSILCFAGYLMVLGALGNLIWALAGNVLRRAYESHFRLMNTAMSLLILWCAVRVMGIWR